MSNENQTSQEINAGNKKKLPMYIIAILVTLCVAVAVLIIKIVQSNETIKDYQDEVSFVEQEKVKLEGELNQIIVTYDSLKTENDSINIELAAQQEYIKKLLKQKASNVYKIKKYQEELGTLRKIMRSYIVQIDSLNTKNKELTAENVQLGQKLEKVETNYKSLSEEKEELSSKVQLAQQLSAKNILAEGIKERQNRESKVMDKAIRSDIIRVCFTVRENKVAEAGNKDIYVRIQRPDEVVLPAEVPGTFEVDGEMLAYSAMRTLEYDNADIDMCIFWSKTEELTPGTYYISLYTEGYEIGNTTLTLK